MADSGNQYAPLGHTHSPDDITWPDLADEPDSPDTEPDAGDAEPDAHDADASGPPARGMARVRALSATHRAGFPAGTGAQRSMDALRGRR